MEKLVSPNGRVVFNCQGDGRFVAYVDDKPVKMRLEEGVLVVDMPDEQPLPTGRTSADFLYPYFGAAYMSYPSRAERRRQFDVQKATGATDILLMAQWIHRARFEQNGWAGPQGFDFRSEPDELVWTIRAIRERGMRCSVMTWDRGSGGGIEGIVDDIVDAVGQLYRLAGDLIETISPAFEIDEGGFGLSQQVALFRRLKAVAPSTRLAAHYNGVPVDATFWRAMRDVGCTDLWVQHGREDSLTMLAEDTRRWIAMLPSEVAYTSFEHSAPAGNSEISPVARDARWRACAAEMQQAGRPLHSFNSVSEV